MKITLSDRMLRIVLVITFVLAILALSGVRVNLVTLIGGDSQFKLELELERLRAKAKDLEKRIERFNNREPYATEEADDMAP